nr:hypothetical protein [Candidatus Cloacimonadota bacterium]
MLMNPIEFSMMPQLAAARLCLKREVVWYRKAPRHVLCVLTSIDEIDLAFMLTYRNSRC